MKSSKFWQGFSIVLAGALLAFGNACSPPSHDFQASQLQASPSSSNGDGYGGKPTSYFFNDLAHPCSELDQAGQPLSNAAVQVLASSAHLVRSSCADITPMALAASQYQISAGQLSLSGQTYQQKDLGDFDLRQAACPTGLNPIVGAARTNLFQNSQDLLDPAWTQHQGVTTQLLGSILGYPRYQISRLDPSLTESWRRVSQFPNVQNAQTYALSFLAQAGSVGQAQVTMYQDLSFDVQFTVDLATGQLVTTISSGATNLSAVVSPAEAGTFVTVYFTPTTNLHQPDIGLGPASENVGASIFAANFVLEDTAQYCQP